MDRTLCAQVRSLLSDSPEAADAMPKRLVDHAQDCDTCRLEFVAAGTLTSLLSEVGEHLTPDATPEQLAARAVLASNSGHSRAPVAGRSPWLWAGIGALAAAGVALVISGGGDPTGPSQTDSPQASAEDRKGTDGVTSDGSGTSAPSAKDGSVAKLRVVGCRLLAGGTEAECPIADGNLRTTATERARLKLSDGTTVTLNHSSSFTLADEPRGFSLKRGEAFVDVVRQKGLPPLAVTLPSGRVNVIGTKLTVKARPRMSVVGVVSGRVDVHGGGQVAPLGQGQQAVMVGDQPPVVGPAPNMARATDWASERPEGGVVEDGSAVTGFGTLRARRPGARKDSEARSLRLADHQVKVNIQGLVARTEITEVFANDTPHTLEGIYSFPLPPGAQIAALDLEVEGHWEHGAVVERDRGDKIWRGVIRNATPKRKKRVQREEWIWVPGPWKDPALMQWKQGNRFELRIFPIPGNGSRRVRIAYTQKLERVPGGRRYVMPLAPHPNGEARADRFGTDIHVGGGRVLDDVSFGGYPLTASAQGDRVSGSFSTRGFKPSGSLVVEVADTPEEATAALTHVSFEDPTNRSERFTMLAMRPRLPVKTDATAELDVVVLVDRSYSTQRARIERSAVVVEELITRLGGAARVQVLACATDCQPVRQDWQTADSATARELSDAVKDLEPLGSSRVDAWFKAAAARFVQGDAQRRVILIGDGVATTGEVETARLADTVRQSLGSARLTTVSLGGEVDASVLRALADAGSGAFVDHGPGDTLVATGWEVASRQRQIPLRAVTLDVPAGVTALAGVPSLLWPGDEIVVTGRLAGNTSGEVVLSGTLDGEAWTDRRPVELVPMAVQGNAFIPRLWAEARIAQLQLRDDAASRSAVVALSKRYHVLSRHTSLIVLESPAMARAFKVEDTRPAVDWTGEEAMEAVLEDGDVASSSDGFADIGGRGRASGGGGRNIQSSKSEREIARPRKKLKKARPTPPRLGALRRPPFDRRRGRRGRWAKRVWYREAAMRRAGSVSGYDMRKLQQRQVRLQERPDSRDRLRDLVRWQVRVGDLKAARELAESWLAKDRMDGEALIELAGITVLEGDFTRGEALLASAVDVDRRAIPAHDRLIELYRAAGRHELACAQSLARALLTKSSTDGIEAAARCVGPSDQGRLLERLSKTRDRDQVQRRLAQPIKASRVRGKIKVDATWSGGGQVDLVVVTPKGRVVSWQGGDRKTTSALSQSLSAEKLGVRARDVGRYRVYAVARKGGSSTTVTAATTATAATAASAAGTVTVRSYGKTRRSHFSLRPGERLALLDVRIERKSRMEFR